MRSAKKRLWQYWPPPTFSGGVPGRSGNPHGDGHSDCSHTILVIEKSEMMRVLHAEHALSDRFMAYILSRNIRVEEDLIDQLLTPARNGWLGRFCCWRALARNPNLNRCTQDFAGDVGGDGWHNAVKGQFFHE